jgi:phosphoribosylanthranilate isomerase
MVSDMDMMPAKICGITQAEDAMLAAELGASAIGFVFYSKSPRCIHIDTARRIAAQLPEHVARVGVFVNPDLDTMLLTAEIACLSHIQLHGDESPALCRQAPVPVIKTIRNMDDLEKYAQISVAAFLVDSKTPEAWGGTGQLADWDFCRQVRERAPVILAGGLNAGNIAAAIAAARPDAIDLSSAVEQAPGVKDHQKLRDFFSVLQNIVMHPSGFADFYLC